MTNAAPSPSDIGLAGTSVIPILVYEDIEVAHDYGLREYGVRDPEDHRWWFSSRAK